MAERDELENSPKGLLPGGVRRVGAVLAALLAVLLASVTAFCCTCFPVGFAIVEFGGGFFQVQANEAEIREANHLLDYAYWTGAVAAILAGSLVCRYFYKAWSQS
jgi:hypothetical protein